MDIITTLSVGALLLNLFALVLSAVNFRNARKEHIRSSRYYLRTGIKAGREHRIMGIRMPDHMLDDKNLFSRGFVHGYLSTGRRLAREGR